MPLPYWQPAWTFFYFNYHFKSNAELVITNTDPALCTSAPTTGFNFPVIASVIARKFSAMEKVILILIVVIMRLERVCLYFFDVQLSGNGSHNGSRSLSTMHLWSISKCNQNFGGLSMKGRIDRKCCFRVNLQEMHFTMKAGGSCENAECKEQPAFRF